MANAEKEEGPEATITSSDVAKYFNLDDGLVNQESSLPGEESSSKMNLVQEDLDIGMGAAESFDKKDANKIEEAVTAVALVKPSAIESHHEISTKKRTNGWTQLVALTEKNFIMKYRSPVSTLFEILTPVALASLLVVGYLASSVTYIDSSQYSNLSFDVPGVLIPAALGFITPLSNSQRRILADATDQLSGNFLSQLDEILAHPLPIPTLSQFVAVANTVKATPNLTSSEFYKVIEQSEYGMSLKNILDLGILHLSPSGLIADSFLQFINETYPTVFQKNAADGTSSLLIKIHSTAEDALLYIKENYRKPTWALIDLENSYPSASIDSTSSNEPLLSKSDLNNVKFTLRMNYTTIPRTSEKIDLNARGLETDYQKYYLSGFLTLQRTIEEFAFSQASSVLSSSTNNNTESEAYCQLPSASRIWSFPMPTPQYKQNQFFGAVGFLLGLVASMGFLYPMSRLVKSLVEEKELRLKETLQILGVKPWAYSLSWVIVASIVFLVGSVFVSLVLHINVMSHSSLGYLFALFALFCSAVMGFSFFVAAFFSKAKLAAIMGPISLFVTIVPYWIFFGTNSYEESKGKIFASLLSCTALSFGANILAGFESAEIGVHSWNASQGTYSFNTCLGMLALDTILYFFLGWYLELVLPSSYGVRRPPYFFLLPSYWGCQRRKVFFREDEIESATLGADSANFERVGAECGSPKVIVNDLVKRYKKNASNAVDHLTLNLYENQITCLLGHNGAGKTSAISVMTGLYPATSGDCTIYGNSLPKGLDRARESMSVCPQHDVLFADLTVSEHLRLFEKIKGINPSSASIQNRANDAGIGDKLGTLSGQLSGGMKRKLSIAIAMCGDPKFILLDEPTTGMDPYARRATWEMLRNAKKNRVILLTTHFMDEAEVLSDHIAVMKSGKLQCFGSPLFLKRRFGLGYTLTVVLSNLPRDIEEVGKNGSVVNNSSYNRVDVDSIQDANLSDCEELENGFGLLLRTQLNNVYTKAEHVQMILSFLQRFIPDVTVIRHSAREVKFRFPNGCEKNFPDLFDAFDDGMRERLGIGGYGVTNCSLEEVFLRLAEDFSKNASTDEDCSAENPGAASPPALNAEILNGQENRVQTDAVADNATSSSVVANPKQKLDRQYRGAIGQVLILLKKRSAVQRRDVMGLVFMIILPALVIALVLLILTFNPPLAGPPIPMTLGLYKSSPFYTGDKTFSVSVAGGIQASEASKLELKSFLSSGNPFVDVHETVGVNSSDEMSRYLMNTFGSHTHPPRLASFVIEDIINVNLNIDWDQLWRILNNTDFASPSSNHTQLSEILGIALMPTGHDSLLLQLKTAVSILHNASSAHAVAALNHDYANYHYSQCTGNGSVDVINYPLPISTQKSIEIRTALSIMCALFLLIPLCFVPSAFIVFVVKEKSCKSKHVQLVSGVNLSSFWIAHYIWDLLMYLILAVLIMVVFAAYGANAAQVFVGDKSSFFATALLVFSYGVSSLTFAYLCSRTFDNHSSAQLAVLGIFFLTGFVFVNAQYILTTVESTKSIGEGLTPFFHLFPAFNIGQGLINLGTSFYSRELFGQDSSPLDWDVAGLPIFLNFILSIPYFGLLLILEYSEDGGSGGFVGRILRKIREYKENLILEWNGVKKNSEGEFLLDDGQDVDAVEDEDVVFEKNRVQQNEVALKKSAKVLIVNLWKIYPPSVSKFFGPCFKQCLRFVCCCCCCPQKPAVAGEADVSALPKRAIRGVTLSIEGGETFGLLGVNGAGKTSTLSVLTGNTQASAGQAYVSGNDVTGRTANGVSEARKHIGFCPQIDPLLDLMTGRETLRMFGALRGISDRELDDIVPNLLSALTLSPHADKPAGTYSGGNKRKLSLGIAFIGEPDVLLIDEASSGMDPLARRKMWDLIAKVAENRLVVLTTHSMEEAEALCTRVTIMVGGKMKCIGSVQHLKSKYLGGYTLDLQVQLGANSAVVENLKGHVEIALPSALLKEEHGLFLRFSIPSSNDGLSLSLGAIFSALEAMKNVESLMVREYSLAQSTLEEVFISFAKGDRS